ncbi:flagellar motor protein MotA [Pigmentiphaga litoralis]|jgi:chemotaxis protein MotA|uniref:flagellar motor stator protein MotA n=1 Tax=Pigmentiphaga litoralis TaxID=516702 RepID=UPI001672D6FC|nr:flagellar motor stator protein MotA [Pigmentiphaga litoralis]GGX36329.1 flagellar motor protein MotA [Pigmentiphaga litoralis]
MLVIIGYIIVAVSVLGGFALHGGSLGALFQPFELLIIAGAALGAFVCGNSSKVVKATLLSLPTTLHGSKFSKQRYLDLLALLYEILNRVRREGLMSIEADVEEPANSPLFQKYPTLLADHHLMEFVTDYLRLMVSGNLNPLELEALMDQEIDTHHHEALIPAGAIQRIADGLPAFGIVAAVMGVVNVMGSVGEPPAILGGKIGAALVGTFVGILLAYGVVGPLASVIEQKASENGKQFECIKVALLASLNGYAPALAVEFGRKVLFSTERPTFAELEDTVRGKSAA